MVPAPENPCPASVAGRVPALDGLRALSIGIVLLAHCLNTASSGALRGFNDAILGRGTLGVTVFFVISGFIITLLLVREARDTGRVDLRDFYLRRAFRIFPVYYAFLGAVFLAQRLGSAEAIDPAAFRGSLLFYYNYLPVPPPHLIAHTWSLCLEEQFYLVWPPVFALLGARRAFRAALLFIALGPVMRVATYALAPSLRGSLGALLHTRFDTLMFGCWLGLAYGTPAGERFVAAIARRRLHWAALVALLGLSPLLSLALGGKYGATFKDSLEGAAVLVLVAWAVMRPTASVARWLNHRAVAHVGVVSYGVYVWQQAFMPFASDAWFARAPFNLVVIFAVAHLSYFGLEKPFLALGARVRATIRRRRGAAPAPVGRVDVA